MDTKVIEMFRNGSADGMNSAFNNPIWALVFLAFLGGRGGGLFGGEGAGNAAFTGMEAASNARFTGLEAGLANLQRSIDTSSIDNKLDGISAAIAGVNTNIGSAICDSTFALNNTINNGMFGVQNSIKDLGFAMQQGFCTTNYNMQSNTQAIVTTMERNTDRILKQMCDDRYADMQARLNLAQAQLAECRTERYVDGALAANSNLIIKHVDYIVNRPTTTTGGTTTTALANLNR